MKEKPVLVSVRVNPKLYKEVKKRAIDRDDSITAVVKRAFEKYVEEKEMSKEMSKDVMGFEEFKKEYSERAAQLVEKCHKGENPLLVKKMRNELEPGYFVASAWKNGTDTIHYEEYWELSNADELTPECVPDVHIEITF